jgi:hypothetical protein
VATGDDFQAEFSVRGSAFRHVGIVIDGTPTQLLLHAIRGTSETGSVSMINTDVLSHASLLAGPHSRQDGDWLGATVQFEIREGSRDRLGVRAAVSGTSASGVFEGPIGHAPSRLVARLGPAQLSGLARAEDRAGGWTARSVSRTPKPKWCSISRRGNNCSSRPSLATPATRRRTTSLTNGLLTASSRSVMGSLAVALSASTRGDSRSAYRSWPTTSTIAARSASIWRKAIRNRRFGAAMR